MKRGTIAVFDALGWKGIWKRQSNPDETIATMSRLKSQVLENATLQSSFQSAVAEKRKAPPLCLRALFLSDTIVVAAWFDEKPRDTSDDEMSRLTTGYVCRLVADTLCAAARSTPPLAYRGCVSYGEFEIREQFMIGQAVDDAASHMDAAEAAVVWLLPSAARPFSGNHANLIADSISPAEFPVKGGGRFHTLVVNALAAASSSEDIAVCSQNILGVFENSSELRVMMKQQATCELLNELRAAATEHVTTMGAARKIVEDAFARGT